MQREKRISPLNRIHNLIFLHTSQPGAAISNTETTWLPDQHRPLWHRLSSRLALHPSRLPHSKPKPHLYRPGHTKPAYSLLALSPLVLTLLLTAIVLSGCAGFPGGLGKGGPDKEARPSAEEEQAAAQEEAPELEVDPYQSISNSMAAGDPTEAVNKFEQAYSKDPDSPETQLLYSSLLISVGKAAEAETVLQKLVENDQADADALYNLALAKGMQGKAAEQAALLKQAIDKDPDHAPAHATLGELYLEKKELDKAQQQFAKSIDANPDNFIARTGYGHVLIRKKEYEEAVTQLDRAVELKPNYPFSYVDRAKAKSSSGDINGALADLTEAVKLDPDHYWNYIDRGKLRLYVNNLEKAYADFNRAAELRPDYFLSYVYRGGAHEDLEKTEAALSDYRKVAELRPDYYPIYQPYALLAFNQKNYSEAAKAFASHYERYKEDHSHGLMAAASYYLAGEQEKGDRYIKKHIDQMPRDTYMYDAARTFIEKGYDNHLIAKLNSEKKITIKTRALFYAALYYELQGNLGLARKYYLEVDEANLYGLIETRLAEAKLENTFDEPAQTTDPAQATNPAEPDKSDKSGTSEKPTPQSNEIE